MFCNIKKSCVPLVINLLKSGLRHHPSFKMPPPDRWEMYTPLGSVINGTRIIAFKVPLKEELCSRIEESEKFTPHHLMSKVAETGKKLGMVVDLTYTKKYYNGAVFKKKSIKYVKIMTAGHNIPNDDVYCTFADCLSDFFAETEDTGSLVGVHCTHGVNRTGYLICRFMIERLNIEPEEAIAAVGKARGHPVERANYLDDLKMRLVGNMTPYPKDYEKNENKYSDVNKNAHSSVKHSSGHPASRSLHTNHRHRDHGISSHHTNWPDHSNSTDDPNWRNHSNVTVNPNWHDHGNYRDPQNWHNYSNFTDDPNWRDHGNYRDPQNWHNHRNFTDDPNWRDHGNYRDSQNWHDHGRSTDCRENHFKGRMHPSRNEYRPNYVHGSNNGYQAQFDGHSQGYRGKYSKHNRELKTDSGVPYNQGFHRSFSADDEYSASYNCGPYSYLPRTCSAPTYGNKV